MCYFSINQGGSIFTNTWGGGVSRLTARNAIRVATRIVMFLVWPRPELSCVVTRNKTLSSYRNYMLTAPVTFMDLRPASIGTQTKPKGLRARLQNELN